VVPKPLKGKLVGGKKKVGKTLRKGTMLRSPRANIRRAKGKKQRKKKERPEGTKGRNKKHLQGPLYLGGKTNQPHPKALGEWKGKWF